MVMPYYVSPEQVMKDRADYARKGIARGKSIVAVEADPGIVIIAENPSSTLSKISEIYDHIAFAGVGKYNEFENLRVAGIRLATLKGYAYEREDVTAKAIASAYAQALGAIFTEQMKPFEVEVLVVQVGKTQLEDEMYRITYDGSLYDEQGFVAMGGDAERLSGVLKEGYNPSLSLEEAIRLGVRALSSVSERSLPAQDLEVAVLNRGIEGRAFRRISDEEVENIIS